MLIELRYSPQSFSSCCLEHPIGAAYFTDMTSATTLMSDKSRRLKAGQALNRHPERVRAAWFQAGGFFDAQDLVQVKYEMLRHVKQDGASKAEAAALFGLSRPAFYQAEAAFEQEGLAGLLPRRRGPKGGHKLTAEVMEFVERRQAQDPKIRARALAREIKTQLNISVHPRSIERALSRKKKRRSPPAK
jgi:transposase